jgi:hypothetical protein
VFDIKCKTENTVTLVDLKQFQGNLKKRSSADIDALTQSIKEDGLLMPIALWQHDGICSILDGHARYEAFVRMAIEEPEILTASLPCIIIDVATEAEAQKALLQITSQYGHVTKKGLQSFVAQIPEYKLAAPIVIKTLGTGIGEIREVPKKAVDDGMVVLKVKVHKDMVKRLTEVLSGVEGVSVL